MEKNWREALVGPETSFKEALQRMNNAALQLLMVVDDANRILGIVTDGDMRRAILDNIHFDQPVHTMMNRNPKTISYPVNRKKALRLMKEYDIKNIPVVDGQNRLVGVVFLSDYLESDAATRPSINTPVVIMAGGKGTRLDPFTKILPKPLIPIGDKPIIEVIMDNFRKYGLQNFIISLNYKAEIIKLYFAENPNDYRISYTLENEDLGTAGSLRLAEDRLRESFIVSNCDVILEMDYQELLGYHHNRGNDATIVGVVKNVQVPYGVIETAGEVLEQMVEKPEYNLIINSGVYLLEPKIIGLISESGAVNMPDLLTKAKNSGYRVGVYPVSSNWFDVGQWEEYARSLEYFKKAEVI